MYAIVLLSLLGIVFAIPAPSILDMKSDNMGKISSFGKFKRDDNRNPRVPYRLWFEKLDDTRQDQTGEFVNRDGDNFMPAIGFYSFVDNDGEGYITRYKVDQYGYVPISIESLAGRVPEAVVASMLG